MQYIADLHIHSRYSRATSKASHLHGLAAWAAIKGIQVVGTGDFTHPAWFAHINETLEEAEPGFFRLREQELEKLRRREIDLSGLLPDGVQPDPAGVRFVLTSEISSIYKRGGRVRKVHNILFAPDLESVRRLNATLAGIGNLEADGRPILGLDSRDLLEIQLSTMPGGFLVPAHIWTPWFSLFGSKSGFDAIEECFDDLTEHVFALETGLSSDPDMNRRISALDRFTLISNSDCHSPARLGRESNLFDTGFDYFSMRDAIRHPVDPQGRQVFTATVEFYPEEGKYHCDGHRKCGVCFEPDETIRHNAICPRCGRPLTIGVLYRVMELADRKEPHYPPGSPAVHSLIPLPEMLSELLGTGPATKKVMAAYGRLITTFGSEFDLLLKADLADIDSLASPMLAEAVRRVREKRVIRRPGFDGEFGVIRVFTDEERRGFGGQLSLFGITAARPRRKKKKTAAVLPVKKKAVAKEAEAAPDPDQERAITAASGHVIVTAGPGAGKTFTLVRRVLHVAAGSNTPCTVITFTNRAADEVRQRLAAEGAEVFVATFHGYCLHWLRRYEPSLGVAGPGLKLLVLRRLFPAKSDREIREMAAGISATFSGGHGCEEGRDDELMAGYVQVLDEIGHVDIDGVVPRLTCLLQENGPPAAGIRSGTGHLFIDEFQDLNRSQFELVRLLARSLPVFAIGDPDQAIYGFRGSDPAYFHRFAGELQPEQYVLARNYRSAAHIVEAAAAVIAKNTARQESPAVSVRSEPGSVAIQACASADAEAGFVAARIEQLLGGTSHREIDRLAPGTGGAASLADIAVLYRTGRQAEPLAAALAARGLPCQVVNLSAFYTTGAGRILYLWILALARHADSAGLLAIAGMEKGIGRRSLQALEQEMPIESGLGWDLFFDAVDRLADRSVAAALSGLRNLVHTLQPLADRPDPVPQLLEQLMARYGLDRDEPDIERFLRLARATGPSLVTFAAHLEQHSDSVVYDPRAEAITLMTLHAAKGLEFDHVFITGVEEDLLPLAPRSRLDPAGLQRHVEEERRLFFVGMTRARESLCLCHAARRPGRDPCRPSRFLAEIPAGLITPIKSRTRKKKTRYRQLSLF